MSKIWQIYYNTILGAIGGLMGWLVVGLIPTAGWNFRVGEFNMGVHVANMVIGFGVGLFIGGFIGAVEGIFVKRSVWRTVLGVVGGSIMGGISGLLGLTLGGLTFIFLKGGLIPRMLGWMALGLFLGVGQGLLSLRFKRASYGLIGGTVAGLVGGALYEILTWGAIQVFGDAQNAQMIVSAIAVALIGASLGSILAATVELAKDGLVLVLAGKRANTEVSVLGKVTLGSSDACDVYLPDEGVEKQQAIIRKAGSGFIIENTGKAQTFSVGQKPVPPGGNTPLANGSLIFMGAAQLRFKAR